MSQVALAGVVVVYSIKVTKRVKKKICNKAQNRNCSFIGIGVDPHLMRHSELDNMKLILDTSVVLF